MKTERYFEKSGWIIEARPRNNHPGRKLWILKDGHEQFIYSGEHFRCIGTLKERDIPQEIKTEIRDTWAVEQSLIQK